MQKIANTGALVRELREVLAYAQTENPFRRTIATQLLDLAERVAGTKMSSSRGQPLYGYDSMEKSYLVEDYPYGSLRCKIRYWLEKTPKKGFRFVSQTENPKNGRWNNPKKSTYARFAGAMYLDSKHHCVWTGIGEYSNDANVLSFVKDFPNADLSILKEFAKAKVKYLEKGTKGEIVWKINNEPKPVTEEDIGRYKVELEQWEEILRRAA